MFRLNKSSSGVSKNHKTNYNMPVHIWDPKYKCNEANSIMLDTLVHTPRILKGSLRYNK